MPWPKLALKMNPELAGLQGILKAQDGPFTQLRLPWGVHYHGRARLHLVCIQALTTASCCEKGEVKFFTRNKTQWGLAFHWTSLVYLSHISHPLADSPTLWSFKIIYLPFCTFPTKLMCKNRILLWSHLQHFKIKLGLLPRFFLLLLLSKPWALPFSVGDGAMILYTTEDIFKTSLALSNIANICFSLVYMNIVSSSRLVPRQRAHTQGS